ncbi:flagellar basal body-associated FliL family protein [Thiocystis violacea]|uniref:flagellar basal body-associated FliL family protein n=1 Tax=Thiocystis violacea TaxID=13725 RepID=UPI00190532AE|nr:flagellar basal body-associated FliL family protein [Thiocystis violacea]MBK1717862.1 flagellar basal body protein FliL [Thiocystis violacea]
MKVMHRGTAYFLALIIGLIPVIGQTSSGGGSGAEGAYPGYLALDPPLVVNLTNPRKARFLRVDIQFFIETQAEADLVTLHMPLIRDHMISLLGGRDGDGMMTSEAREALRTELLASLREAMSKQTGTPAISALYFTGFIVQ